MIQIMDNDGKYHPNEKWHLKKGSKATYVEYWYPYDNAEKKALTWEQYRQELSALCGAKGVYALHKIYCGLQRQRYRRHAGASDHRESGCISG